MNNLSKEKFIENIVLIGHILDTANAQGLINTRADLAHFNSVESALDAVFPGQGGDHLARAISTAAEILGPIFLSWLPESADDAIPISHMWRLAEVPELLALGLRQRGYWGAFAERTLWDDDKQHAEVIWLKALSQLWERRLGQGHRFGIATSLDQPGFWVKYVREGTYGDALVGYGGWSEEQLESGGFHLVILGLLLDVVQMCLTVKLDSEFIARVLEILEPERRRPAPQ